MMKTTLFVILAVAVGLVVGFVIVIYLLRPSPPTERAQIGAACSFHVRSG